MANKKPFYKKFRRTLYETVSDSGNSVLRYRGHDDKEHYVASSEDPDGGGTPMPSGGGMTEVTWQELKDKRDAGKLIPGSLYRITDYQCTTTQENTQSAGHQFDIVLLALSENKLAEEGWAMEHLTDVYDVTYDDGMSEELQTSKCYIYDNGNSYNLVDVQTLLGQSDIAYEDIEFGTNKTANIPNATISLTAPNIPYNYFQNSNLSAWKVWYCLDNDKSRFAWADDSVDEGIYTISDVWAVRDKTKDTTDAFAWYSDEEDVTYFTNTSTPKVGDSAWTEGGNPFSIPAIKGFGHGVIYRLIDEFNNDIKYDFKNIQFKRKITDGAYDANGTETWCYTLNIWYNDMCQDASIVGNTLPNFLNYFSGVYDNVFGYATAMDLSIGDGNTFAFVLGNNVVLSFLQFSIFYSGIYSNTIGNSFYSNTIGDNFNINIIGNYFTNNTIGNGFVANIIRNNFGSNTIGNDFYANTIGNGFNFKNISTRLAYANYGNDGVELATKDDIGDIETALNNI